MEDDEWDKICEYANGVLGSDWGGTTYQNLMKYKLAFHKQQKDYLYAPYVPLTVTPTASDKIDAYRYSYMSKASICSGFGVTLADMEEDIRKEEEMAKIIDYNIAPPYFHTLCNSPKLFFQVESDGGVIITGEKYQCTFSHTMADKSVIHGGILPNGNLFGDRKLRGKGKAYPLRWFSREDVDRGIKPPHQRRREIVLPPGKNIPEKMPHPIGITKETKLMIDNYQGGESKALIQRMETELKLKDKAYAALRTKHAQLQQKHDAILSEVNTYRNGMSEAENAAKMEVQKLREEYERKKTTHRWQVEAVRSGSFEVEGLVAHSWEVEDSEGKLRYLIVTRSAAGTSGSVEKQWLDDLSKVVDAEIGEDRAVCVAAPHGCSTTVLEILPDRNDEADDEIGQF